ncbi:unnamed protein product [Polarella glacialis]|uniref:Uncharacterized protein n=1 Tax=Polarella glacialis TaxID=89957 RepID=A0A813JFW3_POLGL|nr:unnamed protein product [Polarella glacialis]
MSTLTQAKIRNTKHTFFICSADCQEWRRQPSLSAPSRHNTSGTRSQSSQQEKKEKNKNDDNGSNNNNKLTTNKQTNSNLTTNTTATTTNDNNNKTNKNGRDEGF